MNKDYYQILGVSKTASADEIKAAFRKLAHQYHPDKPTGNAEKFKEINEAFQVLSDPQKRSQYDQFGSNFENMGGFGAGGGFDWSNMAGGFNGANFDMGDLGDIFGDFFGGGRGRTTSRVRRGADLEFRLELGFKDAAFGTTKEVQISKHTKCDQCSGSGGKAGTSKITCKTCNGSGQVVTVKKTIIGNIQTRAACNACQGEGSYYEQKCDQCKGNGLVKSSEKIKVEVPGGIEHGMTIKMNGKGEAGLYGGPAGDLYFHVLIEDDEKFERDGSNILSTEYIPYSTLVLGGSVEVETIDGPGTLKIPAGTQSGERFAIKGKGANKFQKSGRGDQIVTVLVEVPSGISKEQRKKLEELGNLGL